MKKVLIAIMLLLSTATMAQRLSVLGIEMGTSIEQAEKVLRTRFGEYNVYRKGTVELTTYNANVGGSEWQSVIFQFQNKYASEGVYSYLSKVELSKNFDEKEYAVARFNNWAEKLGNKYTKDWDYSEDGDQIIIYKEGVLLGMEYSKSNGGDYFWYVTIEYRKNFVDESNDF
jgi:hypothetical protein